MAFESLGPVGNGDHNFSVVWNTVIWVRLPSFSSDNELK